ncbi:MAG: hypothetical protein OXU54_05125 [Gammaproteobacteria bacterium]|nr:hypothetical protein [Gammaproteobacteria bacterium]
MSGTSVFMLLRRCAMLSAGALIFLSSMALADERPLVGDVVFRLEGADKEAYLDSLQFSGALKGEDASIDGLAQEIEALRKQYVSAATPADRERFAPLLKEATNEIVQRLYEHAESYRSLADGLSALYERLRRRSGSAVEALVERERGSARLPIESIVDQHCRPEGDDAPVCVRHDSLRAVEAAGVVASNPQGLTLSAALLEGRWRISMAQAEELDTYAYRYELLLDQLNQDAIQRLHDFLDDRGTLNPQNPDFYLLKRPVP